MRFVTNENPCTCRFVVVPEGMAPGSLLAKLLRSTRASTGPDAPYPRVLVFAADSELADKMATALRAALWEVYRIGLVLPGGDFPTKMLQVCACSLQSAGMSNSKSLLSVVLHFNNCASLVF